MILVILDLLHKYWVFLEHLGFFFRVSLVSFDFMDNQERLELPCEIFVSLGVPISRMSHDH